MKTNDLKKGDWVLLRNGWKAEMWDNKKGNTRVANVHGMFTEAGSIYMHDVVARQIGENNKGVEVWVEDIELTPAQLKTKSQLEAMW